jgi:hypothetical protein
MLYREIIAVCSQIHTKRTNSLCVVITTWQSKMIYWCYPQRCYPKLQTVRLALYILMQKAVILSSYLIACSSKVVGRTVNM